MAPVKAAPDKLALLFKAVWVAVLIGSPDGDVLATLDKFDKAVVKDDVDGP